MLSRCIGFDFRIVSLFRFFQNKYIHMGIRPFIDLFKDIKSEWPPSIYVWNSFTVECLRKFDSV